MSVEKRSLARTGTMSSFEYFTTRAAASVAAVSRGNVEHGCSKNNDGEDAKEKAVPLDVQHLFHRGAPFEMDWCCWKLWSQSERSPTSHCTARTNAVKAPLRRRGRNNTAGRVTTASSKRR